MKTTGISLLGHGKAVPKTTTSGELILAFAGAGGAFTAPGGRGETNPVIVHGDTRAAVDCGRLWPEALGSALGFGRKDIDTFLISHVHPDHTGGLGTIAEMCRYLDQRKPGLVLPDALEPHLWDETLKGALAYDASPLLTVDDYFTVLRPEKIDERTCRVTVGDLEIELFRTRHAPDTAANWREAMVSYGFYLPRFGVFVSMDTQLDVELVRSYADRGAEWFFHEATRGGCPVHTSIDGLREALPAEVRESMFLIHTPDNLRDDEAFGFADLMGLPPIVGRGDAFRFSLAEVM